MLLGTREVPSVPIHWGGFQPATICTNVNMPNLNYPFLFPSSWLPVPHAAKLTYNRKSNLSSLRAKQDLQRSRSRLIHQNTPEATKVAKAIPQPILTVRAVWQLQWVGIIGMVPMYTYMMYHSFLPPIYKVTPLSFDDVCV